uniref:TIR domain-containing protein n=1 Tax=Candidatus Kentrum eta TaxID=2126337 RepID=A0A450ULU7_9GAMM|nr:MAG: TIR domain-containing protein [Candidatus Kentron sp. H]VFJ93509.1 MAG: TIR domain-containing protein [Candidatus Kentron sp. H]VFJ94829.1 MAG: TIR domain-containing protein [Candidatus Kentron sp. H]
MAIKVFVSHAAADDMLASALVDLLMTSLSLDEENIRCTSVPGHKLPVGSESATIIREELGESAVVIGLITKNAISSGWVLFELGATWGAKKS